MYHALSEAYGLYNTADFGGDLAEFLQETRSPDRVSTNYTLTDRV